MSKNILILNPKGGSAKTTTSSLVSSFYKDSKLYEIDKINESASSVNSRDYYTSVQIDFKNEFDPKFHDFVENLQEDGVAVVDVGAVMLDTFHSCFANSDNYDLFDLIIIPVMDGRDDFVVCSDFLLSLKNLGFDSNKIIYGFNRYNSYIYSIEDQFDSFFDNLKILKELGVELKDENYFVIEDSYAIKKSKKLGETLRYFVEKDAKDIKLKSRDLSLSKKQRRELSNEKLLIDNAIKFYNDCVVEMMHKIKLKLEIK